MAKPSATPKPFRVGFIGAGGIFKTHARLLKNIPGVELVAAADPAPAGEKNATEFGITKVYSDHRKLLAAETLDAVCVTTPNGMHAEHSIAASKAGCHVMVEKPMAMSPKECQAMIAEAKAAKRKLVVGFQWRFDPRTRLIRSQIDQGRFGKPLYVRVQALRRRGIPNWGVFGRKDLQGGGPMIDIGVHVAEMAHYAVGSPKPIAASGKTWTYLGDKPMEATCQWPNWDHKTYTVEDLAVGMVRFANGLTMVIESSFAAHIEKDMWTFQIMGEKGGATFDPCVIFHDHNGYMWNESPAFTGGADVGSAGGGAWNDVFAAKMKHFVEVCRDGRDNICPGEDGLAVQQILDGIYRSSDAGREVAIR